MSQPPNLIFKIAPRALWAQAQASGRFDGAPVDLADGFIHFSTAAQVRETAAKHFAGLDDLLLIAIDSAVLERLPGNALTWEPSRGSALFPHLYAPLSLDAVLWVKPLPLGRDGAHIFPEGI